MTSNEIFKYTLYIVAAILVHRHLPKWLAISWACIAYGIAVLISIVG